RPCSARSVSLAAPGMASTSSPVSCDAVGCARSGSASSACAAPGATVATATITPTTPRQRRLRMARHHDGNHGARCCGDRLRPRIAGLRQAAADDLERRAHPLPLERLEAGAQDRRARAPLEPGLERRDRTGAITERVEHGRLLVVEILEHPEIL